MDEILFSVPCPTCERKLAVRDEALIGAIVTCGKCGSMVQVAPPADYRPRAKSAPEKRKEAPNTKQRRAPVVAAAAIPKAKPLGDAASSTAEGPAPPEDAAAAPPVVRPPTDTTEPDDLETEDGSLAVSPWKSLALFAAPIALVIGVLTIWGLVARPEPDEPSQPLASETQLDPPPASSPVQPLPQRLDRRWIPDGTRLLVSVRLSEIDALTPAAQALAATAPAWQSSLGNVLESFNLKPHCIRRITWSVCDLSDWRRQSVVLIELEDNQDASSLKSLGQSADFEVGGAPCRKLSAAWAHPYAVLDSKTIVTGGEPLLRQLAHRDECRLASGPIDRLLKDAPADAHFALFDAAFARGAGWTQPELWLDVWPAGRENWRLLTGLTQGLGLILRGPGGTSCELGVLCESESTAEKVRAAIDQFVPAVRKGLEGRVEGVQAKLQAGQIKPGDAVQYETFLKQGLAALQSARWEAAGEVVWLRMGWNDALPSTAAAGTNSLRAIGADWLDAGAAVDEANHRRLSIGLAAHAKAEGRFPMGAGGGVLLPPGTRLSWIAAMLPYLERGDWYKGIQPNHEWNSPQNRGIAQRTLDPVINPLIAERTTEAGFPVTHYVGVAGVGADAANLDPKDPRAGVFGFARAAQPGNIADGASNTIAVLGVSGKLGPWAAGGPATVRPLTQRPYVNGPDGFGSGQPDGMLAGMADGSVRFVSKDIDPAVLEQLATAGGGEKAAVALRDPRPPLPEPKPAPKIEKPAAKPEAVAQTPAKPKEKVASPPVEAPPEDAADPETRLAEGISEITFTDTPLVEAVRLLGQLAGLPVAFDVESLSQAGVGVRDRITWKGSDTSIGEALQSLLAQRNLAYAVEGRVLTVTTLDRRQAAHKLQKYDVADLTGGNLAGSKELAGWLCKLVSPESWHQAGGQGTVEATAGDWNVAQTAVVHRQIRGFLEKLRAAREKPAAVGTDKAALATRFDRAKLKLRVPVTANFPEPTPLARLVQDLEQAGQTTILVDWPTLMAAGVQPETKAVLKVADQPLSEALVALTQPLGLSYRIVAADVLEITSGAAASSRLDLEFHCLSAILEHGLPADAIVERIRAQVVPTGWSDVGGPGVLYFDKPSQYLVVRQDQPGQVKVQLLLAKIAAEGGSERASAADPELSRRR